MLAQTGTSFSGFLVQTGILIPPFLIAMTVHEFCHAGAAYLLGDDTGKRMGRFSLNPLVHIDPLGLFCLLFIRIGWAKPVPFDPRNFRYPRFYAVLTGFAGPLSNFVVAWIAFSWMNHITSTGPLRLFLEITAYINTMLGVFNMVPMSPLDGGHLVEALVADTYPYVIIWLRRYALFILLIAFAIPDCRNALMNAINGMQDFLKSLAV